MGWIWRAVATLARWGDQRRGYGNRISVISSAGGRICGGCGVAVWLGWISGTGDMNVFVPSVFHSSQSSIY